ncbi:hypothetical protein [uncultured Acinetobacter sp.]|uniref:hypothetical protein n=1 Tax=uncultured Acinetobacter sp. TaxID=165433 RepID=UPI0025908ECB|nr:hypothetical protein [uncultured Acinetobacter sp.]
MMNNKYRAMLLLLLSIVGLNACSSPHSPEGKMVVTAILLSPVLIPAAIVKGTTKATRETWNTTKISIKHKSAIKESNIKGLIEILDVYSTHSSKTDIESAANKMVQLYQNNKLDMTQMDQVLYLAYSYSILSSKENKYGYSKINKEKISKAWEIIKIYSKQKQLYDEEMKKLTASGKRKDCLCDKYNIIGDREVFDSIRTGLYLAELNDFDDEKRKEVVEKCENNIPNYEIIYMDNGGINAYLFCSKVKHALLWF